MTSGIAGNITAAVMTLVFVRIIARGVAIATVAAVAARGTGAELAAHGDSPRGR